MNKRKIILRVFLFFSIFAAGLAVRHYGIFPALVRWIEDAGPWAPPVFVLVYAAAVVLCVPSLILSFAGGLLFNFWSASLLNSLGSAFGAAGAFLIARYFIRSSVEKRIARVPELEKIMSLVRRKGWKIVLLARLSPVFPFFVGNYAFGTTRMSARKYFLASFAGALPSSMVCAYSGGIAGDLARASSHPRTPWEWGLLGAGLAATILLSLYLRRLAAAELRNENR